MFFIFKLFSRLQGILENADKISICTNCIWSTKFHVHLMMPSWLGARQKLDFSVMINNSAKKNCDCMLISLSCQNEGSASL